MGLDKKILRPVTYEKTTGDGVKINDEDQYEDL